jgi:drug/metabolite transporter (DMT)-like permease
VNTAILALVVAAFAALGNALANVMQRKASLEQPPERPFGLGLLVSLVRDPTWLIGFGGMVASFVLQAVALGLGELSAVEPIITLEVPLTLLVASRVFRARLGRREWSGLLLMTAGMIAFIIVLNPQPGNELDVSSSDYATAGGGTAGTIVALIIAAQRGRTTWRTACLGAAAGTSFGLTASLIKAVLAEGDAHGVLGVFTAWQTYVAIGSGITGVVVMQWALHTGPLLAAQPGFTLMDPLVSILWGVLVFNETTNTGVWLVGATAAAIALGIGVSVLAHSPLLTTTTRPDQTQAG